MSADSSSFDKPQSRKEAGSDKEIVKQDSEEQVESNSKQESNESKTEKTPEKEEEESKGNQKDPATWTPVWDDNYKAYYWWNTVTNETTWSDPNEANLDQSNGGPSNYLLDPATRKKMEAGEELSEEERMKSYTHSSHAASSQQPYYQSQDYSQLYTSQAHFNSRTGRFTTQEDVSRLNPESLSIENRATRQMQFYFDVDAYTEQRNKQKMMDQGTKRKLTRKEVEYFKKMKQEKKNKRAREWLLQ